MSTIPLVGKPSPMHLSADVRRGVITGLAPLAIECDGTTIDNGAVVISDSLPTAVGDSCLVAVFGDGLYWVFAVMGGA